MKPIVQILIRVTDADRNIADNALNDLFQTKEGELVIIDEVKDNKDKEYPVSKLTLTFRTDNLESIVKTFTNAVNIYSKKYNIQIPL